jgi:glycosyltransferase involved in cell wall biosynthesis
MDVPIIFVGNWKNSDYGRKLREKFNENRNIYLLDPIYRQEELDQLRCNARLYIHGHSAGGTNPSLVEAMYLGLPVIAYDVVYNRVTTENRALFFSNAEDLVILVNENERVFNKVGENLRVVAEAKYTWDKVTKQYRELFKKFSCSMITF